MKVRKFTLTTMIVVFGFMALETAVYAKIVLDKNAILERLAFGYGKISE